MQCKNLPQRKTKGEAILALTIKQTEFCIFERDFPLFYLFERKKGKDLGVGLGERKTETEKRDFLFC